MKRIILDVPRWHAYLHREARGLATATERDDALQKLEDELFDRLYAGEVERLPEKRQDPKLRAWADAVHGTCERLPAFARLVEECRGEAYAAGTAVEALMAELRPQLPNDTEPKPEQLRRAAGRGCERASCAVDEVREALSALEGVGGLGAGTGSAVGGLMPVGQVRQLAARLRGDARLKSIALLAGRMKRIAAAKRRERIRHGADEITDIETGADLGRLLPSELVKLTHPKLRLAFMRQLVERASLQYELVGHEPLGKGPLVVLVDKSGSMEGQRDVWATALTLALLEEARRDRRVFALLAFDHQVKFESVVKNGDPLPEAALFTSCAGGTEIATAVQRGLDLIEQHGSRLEKADIVLVTDGGSDALHAARLRERARQLGCTILGLGIGVEREWLQPWCGDDIQVVSDLSRLDDASSEKLFAA